MSQEDRCATIGFTLTAQFVQKQRALFGARVTLWGKLLMQNAKKIVTKSRSSYQKLEDVIGCKWSVSVLTNVGKGINRPGELERAIEGISTKVLSERFRKLVEYGLLDKKSFNELPPRTEYYLTEKGSKVLEIILQIKALDESL